MTEEYLKQVITKEDMELLEKINQEKYRRSIAQVRLIATRGIALGLVLGIFVFCWINYSYAKDINNIMTEYGDNAYCYLCGLESMKQCTCMYSNVPLNAEELNDLKTTLALNNAKKCTQKPKSYSGYGNMELMGNITLEKP